MFAPELLGKFDMLGLERPKMHDVKGNAASVREWRDSHYLRWGGAPLGIRKGSGIIAKNRLWLVMEVSENGEDFASLRVEPTTWQNFLIHHWMHGRLPVRRDRVEIEARALRMVIAGEPELPTEFFFDAPPLLLETRHFVTYGGQKVHY